MHIPSSMLNGSVCPVTAAVSVAGVAAIAYYAWKSERKPTAARFAAVSAVIFAAQMLNFPVMNGTSGHLLGGVTAAMILGTPFGVLSLSLVIAVQALLFADGGLTVMGANLVNMALIGAGVGGLLGNFLRSRMPASASIFIAAMASVLLASLAASCELAWAGTIELAKVLPSMLGVHALIGIGEGAATVVLCRLLGTAEQDRTVKSWIPAAAALVAATVISPFACAWPDGLEWVAAKFQFLHEGAPSFVSPMPDYTIPALGEGMLSASLAGVAGVAVVMVLAWTAASILVRTRAVKALR